MGSNSSSIGSSQKEITQAHSSHGCYEDIFSSIRYKALYRNNMEYYKKTIKFKIGILKFRIHMLMLLYIKFYESEYNLSTPTDLIL